MYDLQNRRDSFSKEPSHYILPRPLWWGHDMLCHDASLSCLQHADTATFRAADFVGLCYRPSSHQSTSATTWANRADSLTQIVWGSERAVERQVHTQSNELPIFRLGPQSEKGILNYFYFFHSIGYSRGHVISHDVSSILIILVDQAPPSDWHPSMRSLVVDVTDWLRKEQAGYIAWTLKTLVVAYAILIW